MSPSQCFYSSILAISSESLYERWPVRAFYGFVTISTLEAFRHTSDLARLLLLFVCMHLASLLLYRSVEMCQSQWTILPIQRVRTGQRWRHSGTCADRTRVDDVCST